MEANMEREFQIDLSTEELFVLAGLLGYETVFGTAAPPTFGWLENTRKKIKSAVKQLENKRLMRYDLDGTLFVKEEMKRCMACLCEARTVAQLFTNIKSRKCRTVYILEKDGCVVWLEKLSTGKFRIREEGETVGAELFSKAASVPSSAINEKLLYEEAVLIQQQIASFDSEQAMARLYSSVSEAQAVPALSKILSGKAKYLSVQVYQKGPGCYDTVMDTTLVLVEDKAIGVSVDEYDVLRFCSVSPHQVQEQLQRQLGFGHIAVS